MFAMRQRLLLVIGWLAAAIGAGLVASGAVAVAGGQVLDRPLRPLTAAEVAALPVVSVGSADAIDPPASGGVAETTGEPTDDGSTLSGFEIPGSGGPGGESTDSADETTRWDRFTNPELSETRLVSLDGGTASFEAIDGVLHLLWTTPRAGYVAQTLEKHDTAVTVFFSSNRGGWLIHASLIDDVLEIVTSPTPIA